MAHKRKRHLVDIIEKTKSFSPLIGVLGHRQVGKTTLLTMLTRKYFSLDDPTEARMAEQDPKKYVKARAMGWVALDECQIVPNLFPALKEHVRTTKQKPGQFLLSGSIRFTSKKDIKESLTGRIINFELLPFTISELLETPLSSFFIDAIANSNLDAFVEKYKSRSEAKTRHAINLYLQNGGLPGVCFIRDQTLRNQRLQTYLETMLDRDLRSVIPTTLPYQTLRELCRELALNQGRPLEMTTLQKKTGISRPTLRRLIYALESIFIFRTVRIEGARRGLTLFYEDIGEANWLSGSTNGLKYIQFLFHHCRSEFNYRLGMQADYFQYRTRNGSIAFAVRTPTGILGIDFIDGEKPARSQLFTAHSFLKSYSNSKVLFVSTSSDFKIISSRILICPITAIV